MALLPLKLKMTQTELMLALIWELTAMAMVFLFVLHAEFARAESPSFKEVSRGILASQELISSISFGYRTTDEQGFFVDLTIAAKSPCFYYCELRHGGPNFDVADDYDHQIVYVLEDQIAKYKPHCRTIAKELFTSTDRLPGTLQNEIFLYATGIWPLKSREYSGPFDHAHSLVDIASSTDFIVHSTTEVISGRSCHLIAHKSGRDRLWLDLERGCCIMRREFYGQDGTSLLSLLQMTKHQEVVPGVWIPFKIQNTVFDTHQSEKLEKARTSDLSVFLKYVEIDKVSDKQFLFSPPPGTLELLSEGGVHKTRQIVSGGYDLLDEYVLWITKRTKQYSTASSSASSGNAIGLMLAIVCIAFFVCILVGKWCKEH